MSTGSSAARSGSAAGSAPASGLAFVGRGQMAPVVYERLSKALGAKRAGEVMVDAMTRLDRNELETPQDMLDLAEILVRAGGLVQAVGRSLKVQALLRGAVER